MRTFTKNPFLLPALIVCLTLTFSAVQPAQALDRIWSDTSPVGDWANGFNWLNGVPISSVNAIIGNGNTAQLFTGSSGTAATLFVDSGGVLINGGSLNTSLAFMGQNAGNSGAANLTAGHWTNSTSITLGQLGAGTLSISNGTVVSSTVILGGGASGSGSILLSGSGTNQGVLAASLVSKGAGSGTITFNGGILRVTAFQDTYLSNFLTGDVQIQSGGAFIDTGGTLTYIAPGFQGAGTFTKLGFGGTLVLQGASSYTGGTIIKAGYIEVQGNGASITHASSDLVAGDQAGDNGGIQVQFGGRVTDFDAYLGNQTGSTGSAYVFGAGAQWTQNEYTYVGYSGTGTLTTGQNGAVNDIAGYIGRLIGSQGTATIDNSAWTNSAGLVIGYQGTGTLSVVDNGIVQGGNVTLGFGPTGNGALGVSGAGTFAASKITRSSGQGTITIDFGNLMATTNEPNFLSGFKAGDVLLGGGSAYINDSGFAIGISTSLQGAGGLVKMGTGTLTLSGTNTYAGGTVINSGTLVVSGSISSANAVIVNDGTTLRGTGVVSAPVSIQANGILAPGTGVGAFSTGSETWAGGAVYQLELANAASVPGTGWDTLNITGDLIINATPAVPVRIALHSLNGTVPGLAAGFNGLASGSWVIASYSGNLTGFDPADFVVDTTGFSNPTYRGSFSVTSGSGQLKLVFTPADPTLFSAGVAFPGDVITASSPQSPFGQGVTNAIDGSATNKYLNIDKLNTGFTVHPTITNRPVQALGLISAEDAPERDPASFILYGSTDGVNFTTIASNTVPPFVSRRAVQSIRFANTNSYSVYQVIFPTVQNPVAANSMQISEVELLFYGDITSPNDTLVLGLPAGASLNGIGPAGSLLDRMVGQDTNKVVVLNDSSNVVALITPVAGASIVKALELIGGDDDATYPTREPSSVTLAGSNDGTNFTTLATVVPLTPTGNLELQGFQIPENTNAYTQYRATFGLPQSGNVLQVGELRLFGLTSAKLGTTVVGNNLFISWPVSGFILQQSTNLASTNWLTATNAIVVTNGQSQVTIPQSTGNNYYRLKSQ